MFWLVFRLADPIRSVLRTVWVQYSHESFQARAKPAASAATTDPSDVRTARRSRFSRKYSRNTAGVSLSAMPKPSSSPRGHGVRRGTQSAITNVISTTLIWPKAKFEAIGSSQIDAGATTTTANHHRRSHAGPGTSAEVFQTSRRVSTITVETISRTRVKTVIATLAAGMCSQANGQNRIAASGG